MKKPFTFLFLLFLTNLSFAQGIGTAELKVLQQKEDSLKNFSAQIIQGINSDNRLNADSVFTRVLVRALKTKNSFHYPFDSLQTVSILYAPDSVFRIFTWQLVINENVIRQHGAIQMKTSNGSLKLYPLIDKSDVTTNVADTIGNNYGWIGAIYYKIILKKYGNQNYYTLLGFDENNIRSSRKIIEVLHFNNDEPIFGGSYFSAEGTGGFSKWQSRYIMEYKKEAGPRLNYDKELDMIIMEHLVSESKEPNKKWTLIGDGDYEGFVWKGNKWMHVEKVFNVVTPDGQAPVPNPIRDPSGNIDESKLKGAEEEAKPVKPKGKGDN
jgi:ferredoxin-thioredoxin reductase catalytic subunit